MHIKFTLQVRLQVAKRGKKKQTKKSKCSCRGLENTHGSHYTLAGCKHPLSFHKGKFEEELQLNTQDEDKWMGGDEEVPVCPGVCALQPWTRTGCKTEFVAIYPQKLLVRCPLQ